MAARGVEAGGSRGADGAHYVGETSPAVPRRQLRRTAAGAAGAVGVPVDLSATPVFRILALANRFTTAFGEIYGARFQIGLPEWRTLAALGLHGPITAIRIAELAQIDRGAISRAVATLEARGLLRRAPDANDARKQLLSLTPKGCELHDRIARFAVRRQAWLLAQFTPDEQEQLATLLARLETAVGTLVREHEPRMPARARRPARGAPRDGAPGADGEFDRAQLLDQLDRFRQLLLR